MTVSVELPSNIVPYIDQNGRLTLEGVKLLERMVRAIQDHEARLAGGGL